MSDIIQRAERASRLERVAATLAPIEIDGRAKERRRISKTNLVTARSASRRSSTLTLPVLATPVARSAGFDIGRQWLSHKLNFLTKPDLSLSLGGKVVRTRRSDGNHEGSNVRAEKSLSYIGMMTVAITVMSASYVKSRSGVPLRRHSVIKAPEFHNGLT
jgi:hypothetical protein